MQKSFGPKQFNQPTPITDGNFIKRDEDLSRREGALEEREKNLTEKQKLIDEKLEQLEKTRKDLVSKLEKAVVRVYSAAEQIHFEGMFYRKDVAKRALSN